VSVSDQFGDTDGSDGHPVFVVLDLGGDGDPHPCVLSVLGRPFPTLEKSPTQPVRSGCDPLALDASIEGLDWATNVLRGRCKSEPAVIVRDPFLLAGAVDSVEFRDRR
jgi:hypothetical protein